MRRIFWYPASTSPRPGRSPTALSANATPPVRPLEPWPIDPASKSATLFGGSRCFNQAAAARPEKPPPITAISTDCGRDCCFARKSTVHGRLPQYFCAGMYILELQFKLTRKHFTNQTGENRKKFRHD